MSAQTVLIPHRPQAEIRRAAHRGILYLYPFDDNSLSIQINTETLYISCPPLPNLEGHTVERFAHVLLAALHDIEQILQQRASNRPGLPDQATHFLSAGNAKDKIL